jgi:uncharacterized lipoprotein
MRKGGVMKLKRDRLEFSPVHGYVNETKRKQSSMNTTWITVIALASLTTGCAFTAQAVKLQPQIQVTESSRGRGHPVQVTVVDERPRSTLGTRGARGVGAELTVEGDLVNIVRSSISDGLKRQGFIPTRDKTPDGRELRVEIRNLDYGVTVGFWAGSLRTECGLKGICIQGDRRPYEQLHRGEYHESVQVVQTAESNNVYVNAALSKALNALLQDQPLSACLAE